jgi:acetyl esterase/lipase
MNKKMIKPLTSGTLLIKLFIVLISTFALNNLSAQEIIKVPWTLGYEPTKTIVYSTPTQGSPLKLDIFFPEGHPPKQPLPVIVFFFGGGWNSGNTEQFYGFSKYFAARGIVAISAQYRTKKSHSASPKESVEDGKTVIRYLRDHAGELGINPNKLIAGGGSAGGHVAACAVMCPKIDATPDSLTSSIPNTLVLYNPVYDNGPDGYGHDRVKAYWQAISPMHNIRPNLPPTVIFFGTKDIHVSVSTINAFQKIMKQADNDSETHIYKNQKHGFFHISKGGQKMFEDVITKTDTFLSRLGYLKGKENVKEWTEQSIERLKSKKNL